MSIFANIVRGGQLFLHAIRMFRQVFKFLLYCTFGTAVVVYSVKAFISITLQEAWAFYDYFRAQILNSIFLGHIQLEAHYYNNIIAEVRASSVPSISYFIERKDIVIKKLIDTGDFTMRAVIVAFVLLSIFFIRNGLKKSGEKFNRGAKVGEFKATRSAITRHNKARDYKGYSLAGMPYPYYAEMEHTLVVGATGVGKTVLISDLVEQIRKRGDRAIIYDKKCDYITWFYDKKKDFILNPFDKRGSKWNLLAEMEHIGHLKPLTQAFIPDKPGYSGDKIWDEAARIALSGILEKFIGMGENLTNREIVDRVLRQDLKEVSKLVRNTYAQGTLDLNSPKTAASVLFVLSSHLNSLRLTRGTKNESFSIKKWLRDENRDSILFISSQHDLNSELAPLITAWFEIAISGILSQSQNMNRKTWVILDELPTIHKIPSLPQGLSVARSYGGCFVLGMQNIAQMREIYGKNTTEDISSECNTRCIFKTNDPDTARWMVQNLGEEEITEFKEGVSYGAHAMRDGISVSEQSRIKSLILPSEIQTMKKLNLLLKMPNYPVVKTALEYKPREEIECPFVHDKSLITGLQQIYQELEELDEEEPESNDESDTHQSNVAELIKNDDNGVVSDKNTLKRDLKKPIDMEASNKDNDDSQSISKGAALKQTPERSNSSRIKKRNLEEIF